MPEMSAWLAVYRSVPCGVRWLGKLPASGSIPGMSSPRLNVSERMRSLLAYPKLAGSVPRIFILQSDYWLDGACANAAHALGWELESARVEIHGVMSKELVGELLNALIRFRPDFIFTVNLSGMDVDGMFARLFDDLRMPYVTWFVDDPRTIVMGRDCYATDHAVALTWDEAIFLTLWHSNSWGSTWARWSSPIRQDRDP